MLAGEQIFAAVLAIIAWFALATGFTVIVLLGICGKGAVTPGARGGFAQTGQRPTEDSAAVTHHSPDLSHRTGAQ